MKRFFASLVSVVMALILVTPTSAITEAQLYMFAQTNALFYDPSGCNFLSEGAFNGDSTAGLSDLQASFVDTYHDIAATLSVGYGIPWEAVMAQGIWGSASGTSKIATEKNNFFGVGIVGSDLNSAFSYDSPAEGWKGYYEDIRKTPVYRENKIFVGEAITNPYVYIERVQKAGYTSDPDYVKNVSKLIGAIEKRAAKNGWHSSAQLASMYPEMLRNAAANAVGTGSGADADSGPSIGSLQVVCSGYVGSGALVSGGMDLQEAISFMEKYRSISPRSYDKAGGDILNKWKINDVGNNVATGGCTSDLENCVAFVQYFICEYGNVCMGLPDGSKVVGRLLSSGKGFVDGGTVPMVYAVFSTTRPTAGTRSGNHTGVILGIDKERGKVVVGEAGCGSSFSFTTAHEYNLSDFTDGSHIYAYTNGLIGF